MRTGNLTKPAPGLISGFLLICILLTVTACQKVPPQTGLLERQVEGAKLSGQQLRILLNDFVPWFADTVEESADQIMAQTTDPEIRHNALMWKINAIPACFRAGTRRDSLGALLDVWILCEQMLYFFEDGAGNTLFGPFQMIAIRNAREMKEKIENIARLLVPTEEQFEKGRSIVHSVAEQAPIESLYFTRKLTTTKFINLAVTEEQKLVQVVSDLTADLVAIQSLLKIYADHLPDQVRWQTELLLEDAERVPTVKQAIENFGEISDAVDRMTIIVELLPKLIEQERALLLADIDRQRLESFAEIERMRLATLQFIQEERMAVFDHIKGERTAAIKQLGEETLEVRSALGDMTLKTTDALTQHSRDMIDLVTWRMYQMGALLLAALIIILLIDRRLFQRK